MPISDYLLSLALAMHPQGGHPAVTLSADALAQPAGGASLVRIDDVNVQHKKTADAGSKDPITPQFVIKGNNGQDKSHTGPTPTAKVLTKTPPHKSAPTKPKHKHIAGVKYEN